MSGKRTVSNDKAAFLATKAGYVLERVKAQPAKSGITCVLCIVLVVVLARTFRQPSSAKADIANLIPDPERIQTVETVIESEEQAPLEVKPIVKPTRRIVTKPRRDIFAIHLNYFPKPSIEDEVVADKPERVDVQSTLEEQVRSFSLQSTITGSAPSAYIDGMLVRQGDAYRGFTVCQVSDRYVTLEKQGHRFQLYMAEK